MRTNAAGILLAVLVCGLPNGPAQAAPASRANFEGLYLKTYGDPTNQPLIFIHGGPGFHSADFEFTTAAALAERGYFVVVYDQRGQGRSDEAEPSRFTYRQYVDDLKRIIDHLGLKDPVLIGHSHGGHIATRFDQAYPGLAKKIVLVSAPVVFRDTLHSILENCSRRYEEKGDLAGRDRVGALYYELFLDSGTVTRRSPALIGAAFAAAIDCGLYAPPHPQAAAVALWRRYAKDRPSAVSGQMSAMAGFLANEDYVRFNDLDWVYDHKSRYCGLYGDADGLFTPLTLSVIRNALAQDGHERAFRIIPGASHSLYVDRQQDFLDALKTTCGL
jgi:proline iminopeptidase